MSETTDQARTRRRWISLAEFVAVAGLLIGALGLYNSWSDRRDAAAEKRAAATARAREGARFDLRAEVEGGRRVVLRDPRHELQEVAVTFPSPLKLAVRRPMSGAVIEREWFEDALLKATDGGEDEREGRLPVLVTARYLDGDVPRTGSAIMDVAWRTDGRVLLGRSLTITAARLRERSGTAKRLDTLWLRDDPRRPSF